MRLTAIRDLLPDLPGTPPIVAIDGRGSSGKSTLSRRLAGLTQLDGVIWSENSRTETDRRSARRVAAGEMTPSDQQLWMAEELPFVEAERTWERALVTIDGTRPLED